MANVFKGGESWCAFQRDIGTGKRTNKPVKWPLTQAKSDVVRPIFIRLTNKEFLDRRKQASTQNSDESFNALAWILSPKEQHNAPMEATATINIAACHYNSGME